MTKEDFAEEMKKIAEKKLSISDEERRITKEYINHHRKFDNGEKVQIVRHFKNKKETFLCFVVGHRIGLGYKVVPVLTACKKDGTNSKFKHRLLLNDTIHKIDQ